MRKAHALAAALALSLLTSACGAPQTEAAAPSAAGGATNCDRTATHVVAFSAPDAEDVVEARSFGPECRDAVVMIIVRRADGAPLYAWSTARHWVSDRAAGITTGEQMQNFLQEWTQVSVDSTMALPDWPQREQAFTDNLGAFMSTPLPREQYLDVRGRGAPRLCFATGIESGTCIYYDPQSRAAEKVLETGS